MRSKFKWILTCILAFTLQLSFAQEKTVSGVVSDESGALPGVNIKVKGAKKGIQTDLDGKFSISVNQGGELEFSFVGYETQVMKVGASNKLNIKLQRGIILEDVVVNTGYDRKSTKPKSVIAGTTITSETLKNRPNVSFIQSLQGNSPGLVINTNSGSPGSANIDVTIRGLGSINSDTTPLYVIDGVPANGVVFRSINSSDIESITVLRDAIATSIYGNRGANGVILVKTKTGKFDSKQSFSYSVTTGTNELQEDHYGIANSQQLLTIERSASTGAGFGANPNVNNADGVVLTDAQINAFKSVDYRKVFFNVGTTTNHNLSFTFGGKNVSNFSSISYMDQEGIVPTTNFKRFTFRTNTTARTSDEKLVINSSFTAAFSRRYQLVQESNSGTTASINNNTIQNPLQGVFTALPYLDLNQYDTANGQNLFNQIGTNFNDGNSAYVLLNVLTPNNLPNRINELKILGNISATYNISKAFSFTSKLGIDLTSSERTNARAPWSYLAIAVRETNGLTYGGLEQRVNSRDFSITSINSLTYTKKFKEKHSLDVSVFSEFARYLLSSSAQRHNGLNLQTYAFGAGTGWMPNDNANFPNNAPTVSGSQAIAGTFSYFGTIAYDFDSRFGFEGIVRRDASYRFIDEYKWGTFWSIGARWNIDKEDFMKNSPFSMLKLRFSYGTQGNQNLGYAGIGGNAIYTSNNLVRDLVASGIGYDNNGGLFTSQIPNNTLQWEEQVMTNIGIDFEVFKNRLSGNIDVYRRQTNKLLNNINISAVVGNGTTMSGNNGTLRNDGIELLLRYKLIKDAKNVKLTLNFNTTYNHGYYYDIERTVVGGSEIRENGARIGEYYMVPYVGVNPATGNLLFLDSKGSYTESPTTNDLRRTGKSYAPAVTGGFGFNFDYSGFFVDAQFSYAYDVWAWDNNLNMLYNPASIGQQNKSADLLNAWSPTNTQSSVPSLFANNYSLGTDLSDIFLRDASFLRMKNVMLGYNVNPSFLAKTFIKSVKIFAQLENYLTWTKWKGFDPEVTTWGNYPLPKTTSFGLNLEF
ncbi:MAG: SusC/RagA family TonB-linked outer membrane protein [Flavobacterium sp. BFFFF2]|nr:MAG: SusC/RagA family TonB-linked outer membrane protein [Flavobacterium sp. BFFFF2]